MTKSNHPDADYTPNDIGPPEKSNTVEMWDDFEDQETNELIMSKREVF